MASLGTIRRVACFAASALAFAAAGVSAQQGPTARAVVRASATVVSPVAVQAPSSLQVLDVDSKAVLRGTLQVTSPAPHVVEANAETWARNGAHRFSPVLRGSVGTPPQEVRVDAAPAHEGGAVRITYVVAIIL